ncbi:hypothetical protein GOBAR_AA15245 [Gossypium barbadense]|uniref:Uncharacterized protein n=1 Tax=Gossypium barbadense TaxID=3634 RepID=A0A2P5XQ07_GOSBA|nr:hypothetical protein GOBAR_AA15245 [Gossypium barbadense]
MEVRDDHFSIKVRERRLTEMKDDSLNIKAKWKKIKEDNILESGSVARTSPEILSEGREIVKEVESESVSKENKIGEGDEVDKCKGWALKEVGIWAWLLKRIQ